MCKILGKVIWFRHEYHDFEVASGTRARQTYGVQTYGAPADLEPDAAPAAEAGAADNLKKMTGIGPALEKKLNGAGITTFAQVAALTDAQIAELEEQLGLSGRFEKDGWVEQAKELAKDA